MATLTGLALTWVVLTAKSEPQAGPPPDRPAPMVAVIEAAPSTHQLLVHTQGTIDAKRRVDLVAQVAGKVVEVSDAFADGGFFEKDDVLLTIERDDYEFALARAESALAQASNVWPKSEDAAGRRVANGESWVRMKPTIFSKEAAVASSRIGGEGCSSGCRGC